MNASAVLERPAAADSLSQGLPWALAAHALLLAALAFGVSWRSHDTDGVAEAELWASVPQQAAPAAQELPPPQPPKVEPKLAPEPDARAERDAEIAERREKERKQKLQREEAERKEREAEKKRRADDAKKQERLEKAKAEKAEKAEQQRREQLRQENLRRMQGLAGASGAATATGTALKSAGPSAGYAGRIQAYIRPRITFTGSTTTRLEAEVEVRCAPDGLIIARRLVKSSGDAQYDKAVLDALDKAERIPRDTDGTVPAKFPIVFKYPD